MIPVLININSVWDVLPPGIHDATLSEIENRFATNDKRKRLFDGFKKGVKSLTTAGCSNIFLDGSFITAKPEPGDYDVCWNPVGVDVNKLDPVLLDFTNGRKNQKLKLLGEFFPSSSCTNGQGTFMDFFQTDRYTGRKKGIIRVLFN